MCILSQHSMDSLLLTGALMPEGGPITLCVPVCVYISLCVLLDRGILYVGFISSDKARCIYIYIQNSWSCTLKSLNIVHACI